MLHIPAPCWSGPPNRAEHGRQALALRCPVVQQPERARCSLPTRSMRPHKCTTQQCITYTCFASTTAASGRCTQPSSALQHPAPYHAAPIRSADADAVAVLRSYVWNHGVLCCLCYTLALSFTGVFVKLLGHRVPVVQVAAIRSAVAWLTSAVIAHRQVRQGSPATLLQASQTPRCQGGARQPRLEQLHGACSEHWSVSGRSLQLLQASQRSACTAAAYLQLSFPQGTASVRSHIM
jgi:hypothetical protein